MSVKQNEIYRNNNEDNHASSKLKNFRVQKRGRNAGPLIFFVALIAGFNKSLPLYVNFSYAAEGLSIMDFGATCNGVADDTKSIRETINKANNYDSIIPPIVRFPAGICVVSSTLPLMTRPISIIGEGSSKTILKVEKSYIGDVFAWSDVWMGASFPPLGTTADLRLLNSGPELRGITILGDRSSPHDENAVMLYDRVDHLSIYDLSIYYIKGNGLSSGSTKRTKFAYLRESTISKVRLYHVGDKNIPAVRFGSHGAGDASNEVNITDLSIYAPYDVGLVVMNDNVNVPIRDISISELRVEGLEHNPYSINADLVDIGSEAAKGNVANLSIRDGWLINPYAGKSALRLISENASSQPFAIFFQGSIEGGDPEGNGLTVDDGKYCQFVFQYIYTKGTNITIGKWPDVGGPLVIQGSGEESSWTFHIDASSLDKVLVPKYKKISPVP